MKELLKQVQKIFSDAHLFKFRSYEDGEHYGYTDIYFNNNKHRIAGTKRTGYSIILRKLPVGTIIASGKNFKELEPHLKAIKECE